MTAPFVSFVFPAHAGGLKLLRRSVAALRAQTADPSSFEAVIAVDAPAAQLDQTVNDARRELAGEIPCRVVPSPRTRGREAVPHRNHARNAGARAARGEYLWVLDCDMMPDPNAVEHLMAIVSSGPGKPVVVTPCLAEPVRPPNEWLRVPVPRTAPKLIAMRNAVALKPWTSSSKLALFSPGSPSSARLPDLIEGQPAFPRKLWEVLGGYDERYVGYGGNKVSFVRALTLLDSQEGLIEVHLLKSCLFLHQPHKRDPLRFDDAHRSANWALYREHIAEMQSRAPWWQRVVEALQ